MADKVRWGVMGNATIARICVIPAIQRSYNSTVHALATNSPELARQTAKAEKIPNLYGNYNELLTDPDIDVIYIPLPNHLHHPWTLKALRAGKHVLCEKPLACSALEAREMADAALKTGVLLMEAFMYRFHPRSRRIKEMVANGSIGTPRLVRSAFCYNLDEKLLESGECTRLKPEMGGGALLDVGCYGVSLSRWLLDMDPTRLQAQALYHPGGVDVHFVALLRFGEKSLATLEASFISALQQTYTVAGTKGVIELPHDAFIPWEKDAVFIHRSGDKEKGNEHVTTGVDEYRLMVEHFTAAVNGKIELLYSPEESVRNMQVIEVLAEAARTGRTISQ